MFILFVWKAELVFFQNFLCISPMDAGAVLHCFSRWISRELDWKWTSLWYCKWKLCQLHHNGSAHQCLPMINWTVWVLYSIAIFFFTFFDGISFQESDGWCKIHFCAHLYTCAQNCLWIDESCPSAEAGEGQLQSNHNSKEVTWSSQVLMQREQRRL